MQVEPAVLETLLQRQQSGESASTSRSSCDARRSAIPLTRSKRARPQLYRPAAGHLLSRRPRVVHGSTRTALAMLTSTLAPRLDAEEEAQLVKAMVDGRCLDAAAAQLQV